MDRLSPGEARPRRRRQRRLGRGFGLRHLVALAIVAWVVIELMPLNSSLPAALGVGGAIRRLHGELAPLRAGWTDDLETTGSGAGTFVWEWSYGPVSTIAVQPGWSAISLDVDPVTCPDGKPQRIVFSSPGVRARRVLTLTDAWEWYRLGLGWMQASRSQTHGAPASSAGGSRELAMTYGCVVVPADLHDGDPDTRPLAIEIAGLEFQTAS